MAKNQEHHMQTVSDKMGCRRYTRSLNLFINCRVGFKMAIDQVDYKPLINQASLGTWARATKVKILNVHDKFEHQRVSTMNLGAFSSKHRCGQYSRVSELPA